ncbi:Uncharacterised protein [uncultured archaeon]|nr:Uncharacterised protein [uncultured archaeon]
MNAAINGVDQPNPTIQKGENMSYVSIPEKHFCKCATFCCQLLEHICLCRSNIKTLAAKIPFNLSLDLRIEIIALITFFTRQLNEAIGLCLVLQIHEDLDQPCLIIHDQFFGSIGIEVNA